MRGRWRRPDDISAHPAEPPGASCQAQSVADILSSIPRFGFYEAIVAAHEAHQISDAAWETYMERDDFAAWYLAGNLTL